MKTKGDARGENVDAPLRIVQFRRRILQNGVEAANFIIAQRDVDGAKMLLHLFHRFRSHKHTAHGVQPQDPGNGQLNKGDAFVRRQLTQLVGDSKIACERLSLEPSQLRPLVVLCKLMARSVSPGEQSLCERTVNKNTDAVFSQ